MRPQRRAGARLHVVPARLRRVFAAMSVSAVLALVGWSPPAAAAELMARATPLAIGSWQASVLDLPAAWQLTQGSPNIEVAVVDTGVQADHAALNGRVLLGFNMITNTTDASDDNGHGTAAAGIVAATCPRCRILPVKVLAANGTGDWGTIAKGIVWAANHRARVINLSVGAPRGLDVLASAISQAVSKGAIVVAAAGNDGGNQPFYPAAYPNVVSVAGIDQNEARYAWSDFGPWVTVAAPGCSATTWIAGGYTADFCGTSTAAPFVAGVAGLALSYRPTLTPSSFVAAVRLSATKLPDPSAVSSGSVDAYKLLLALGVPTGPPVAQASPPTPRAPTIGRA